MNKLSLNLSNKINSSILLFQARSISLSCSHQKKLNGDSLKGIFPPIPTPFIGDNHSISYDGLMKNFESWDKAPFTGYLVQGSNGEYPFLTTDERIELVNKVKNLVGDQILMAGSGCESTSQTIEMSNRMADKGADVVLVIPPCYYKSQMSASVLLSHYLQVAENSLVPIVLYNMPANTGINIPLEVITTLAHHPNCIGIKESGGDITRIADIIGMTLGLDFKVLAGSASFLQASMSVGAVGGIAALANVLGNEVCQLYKHCENEQWKDARELQLRLIQPNAAVTTKFGVSGLKATLDWVGLYGGAPRPPLQPLPGVDVKILKSMFNSNGFFEDEKRHEV